MKSITKISGIGTVKYYATDQEVQIDTTYKQKNEEFRGVWVSTVHNIDLPLMTSIDEYKAYLLNVIETTASFNMNKIIFQVRPANDAFYQSKMNPWSRFITGTEGQDPGFDVLEFMIFESKKRGIAVHAWMNPYRVSTAELTKINTTKEQYLETLSEMNFARKHPELTILDGINKVILKPASEVVRQYVVDSIMEVIENYDIEGIHIDDYFYPYAKVPDEFEIEDYNAQKIDEETFSNWRRRNVDLLIEKLSIAVWTFNNNNHRNISFGISPFALFRTNKKLLETGWEKGSMNNPKILQCYDDLYSDIYKWMEQNWIDYVVPQAYFPFEHEHLPYADIVSWWAERALETNTLLYVGQAFYLVGTNEIWQNPEEITNQLIFNNQISNIKGTIFFTLKNFLPSENPYLTEAQQRLKNCWNKKASG